MEELVKYLFETYKIDSGDIKKKGSRKILSDSELIKELGVYVDDNDLDCNKKDREQAITTWKTKISELKSKPKSDIVIDFITHTFQENNVKITVDQKYTQDEIVIEENDVYTILEANMFDWNRENPDSKISAPELKAKLKEISRSTFHSAKRELISKLAYNSDAKIEEWLKLSHKALKIRESFEIYSIMVKHWVWMVKRKMLTRTTKNQFVLNYYGKPSCGKSFFVKLMTSPLSDFRHNNADLTSIQDERSIPGLGSNFVHFLDELSTGTTKTISSDQELAKIKNIITADTDFKYRPMGTNAEQSITPRTSLIAASNFHIFDVIMDSSGMRRWFEFNVGLETNKYVTNHFDILRDNIFELWTGVDEDKDEGYLNVHSEIGKEIYKIQDSYVRKDSFELWLESVEFVDGKMHGPEAHQYYKDYCISEGMEHKTKQIQSFYARINSIGISKSQVHGRTMIHKKIVPKAKEVTIQTQQKSKIEEIKGFE